MSEQPTPAAQILRITAMLLDLHPTKEIDHTTGREALDAATTAVTSQLPDTERERAARNARTAMPVANGGTCAQFANRLRATAENVR